jgi:predicted transposase YdaD
MPKMPYITSVERIGYERGRKEGRVEDRRSIVPRLLERKFGQVSQEMGDRISTLSPELLEDFAMALLDFNSIDDLGNWLESNI